MAVTSTLKQIVEQVSDELDLGLVLSSVSNTDSTITDVSALLTGPVTGGTIGVGSWVLVTAGDVPGTITRVKQYEPSTGTLTIYPEIATDITACIVFYLKPEMDKGVRVVEAISRALKNRAVRPTKTPLTFVSDGDLRGASVADYWTKSNAGDTLEYVSAQTFPVGSAVDVAGSVGLSRVLQLTSTAAGTASGNGIRVQQSTSQRSWYFLTAIRLVSGTGTASFQVFDNTNAAAISLQVQRGNDSNTLTTTTFGDFMICEGTLQLPPTCAEIAPRLVLSAGTMVAQMGPVIMYPQGAVSFPLPNRIESANFLGNFYCGSVLSGPGGLETIAYSEPITTEGRTHSYSDNGDHLTVTFNFHPYGPTWYDEFYSEAPLTAMTDTTTFSLDRVVKWAKYELLKMFYYGENARHVDSGAPIPSKWKTRVVEAGREASRSDYEPTMINVVGRT